MILSAATVQANHVCPKSYAAVFEIGGYRTDPDAVRQFPVAAAHAAATVTDCEPIATTPVLSEGAWSEIQSARVGAVVESCLVPLVGQVWEPLRNAADRAHGTEIMSRRSNARR